MKKADPKRVARTLDQAFLRWRSQQGSPNELRARGQTLPSTGLAAFCRQHHFNYRMVSKWLREGLRYPHPDSVEELKRLCGLLGVKWRDLWKPGDEVRLPADEVRVIVTDLLSLAYKLRKALGE